jgi:pSer/pThr/pTyr-binding forkhead associated (FHA) protein
MQIILKPVSHPQLGEIQIKDRLFPIGRHEPPFDGFGAEVVAKLSRRHARIFTQDDSAHIVDLNSLNGTTVNGVPLDKQSRQLQHNDEINFAGLLIYRVSLEQGDTTGDDATVVLLTLIPEQRDNQIEPIVVAEYPFLISKSDETFARYRERLPDQYKFLSRRHAHFFLRNHEVLLEDLGSTNGTFVGGQRLDEHARVIHDGDTIAFGGNDFSYRAHIKTIERKGEGPLDEASMLTEALHTSTDADVTRTTFVTSANSFIDIFCAADEEEDALGQAEADEASGPAAERQSRAKVKQTRPKGRAAIFMGEARRAFKGDDGPGNRKGRWWAAAILVLVAGLIGLAYLQDAEKRSIERLVDEGSFDHGIELADAYLQRHPDDQEMGELALKAISRQLLPDWQARIQAGEFTQARDLLDQTKDKLLHTPSAGPLFEMLHWFTDQAEFMQHRGGPDSDILLFQDEDKIVRLIDWWDRDSKENQRLAIRIAQYEPAFGPVQTQALSWLRNLRNEKSLYLAAIDELKETLKAQLAAGDQDDMTNTLGEFKARYPRIVGIENLERDLDRYLPLQQALDQAAWLDATELLHNTRFLTPPFREQVARLRSERLPPQEIASRYQRAQALWQQGQGDAAITILQELANGDWGAMASNNLPHKGSVWEQYQYLVEHKAEADYPQRLFELYQVLRPAEDGYFIQTLQADYTQHRAQALQQANRALQEAGRVWSDYRNNGRITGVQRLEAGISSQYQQQAQRLSKAFDRSRQGVAIYRSLNTSLPDADQSVYQEILRESRLQRRSLQELNMVLEAKLLRDKLALLPEVDT